MSMLTFESCKLSVIITRVYMTNIEITKNAKSEEKNNVTI